jgi:hypothetical protein
MLELKRIFKDIKRVGKIYLMNADSITNYIQQRKDTDFNKNHSISVLIDYAFKVLTELAQKLHDWKDISISPEKWVKELNILRNSEYKTIPKVLPNDLKNLLKINRNSEDLKKKPEKVEALRSKMDESLLAKSKIEAVKNEV